MPFDAMYANQAIEINRVYDKVWVEEIVISALDPNADANARVRLRYYAEDSVFGRQFAPDVHTIELPNLLATAASDSELDAAVTSLMSVIRRLAVAEGIARP